MRRNLLGRNAYLLRQQDQRRRLTNIQRATVRSEQIFVTPEEARRKRNRLYQNYFAGPAPVVDLPAVSGIFMMTSEFPETGTHRFYAINDDNSLSLISTHSFGVTGLGFGYGQTAKRLGDNHYLNVNGKLKRSADGCLTWQDVFDCSEDTPVAFTIDAGGRLWLICQGPGLAISTQGVYSSDDDGVTWDDTGTRFNTSDGSWHVFSLEAHPTDPDLIAGFGYAFNAGGPSFDRGASIYSVNRGSAWLKEDGSARPGYFGYEYKQCGWTQSGKFIYMTDVLNAGLSFPLYAFIADHPSGPFTSSLIGTSTIGIDWANPVIALHTRGGKVIVGGNETFDDGNELQSSHLYLSENDGINWNELTGWVHEPNYDGINSFFYDEVNDRLILLTTGPFEEAGGEPGGKLWFSSPPGENWILGEDLGLVFGSQYMMIWK